MFVQLANSIYRLAKATPREFDRAVSSAAPEWGEVLGDLAIEAIDWCGGEEHRLGREIGDREFWRLCFSLARQTAWEPTWIAAHCERPPVDSGDWRR